MVIHELNILAMANTHYIAGTLLYNTNQTLNAL